MIYFYVGCFLVTFVVLLWGVTNGNKMSLNQSLVVAVVLLGNGGHLALAAAANLEEAILANKVCYISACFLPMLLFITICEVCHIHIKTIFMVPMYVAQILLYFAVCTIGYHDWYYTSTSIIKRYGVTYLIREYGPLHMFYPLTMYGYALVSIIIVVVALRRQTIVSRKDTILILIGFGIGVGMFAFEKIYCEHLEIMPMVNTTLLCFILKPVHHINTYNLSANTRVFEKHIENVGHVIFSKHFSYMEANDAAVRVFPELKSYRVDERVPIDGSFFRERIYADVKNFAFGKPIVDHSFAVGDRHYEYEIEELLNDANSHTGYILTINDVTDHYEHVRMIKDYNENLEAEVREKTKKIRDIQQKTLLGMAQMVESRDLSTGGHIKRTSLVVGIFAKELLKSDMGFDEEFLHYVERSAPMHDLGKIAVDDQILRKQGKFTDEEYEVMKKHSAAGAEIVRKILTGIEDDRFVEIAINVAHYHHEKVNGKGYPEGLAGDDIPVEARIMALADVFDALVSKRCYKEAFSFDKAFSIIKEDSGSHFDAKLAEVFIACRPKLEDLYNSFED